MGVLTVKVKKALAEKLDSLIELGFLLEFVDGPAIKTVLSIFDEKILSRVDQQYHDEINDAAMAIVNDQWDEVSSFLDDVLAGEIHTPLVDGTDEEKELYKGLLDVIINYLKKKLNG